MTDEAIKAAEHAAGEVVNALGGYGIFGVELFVKGDKVIFNEVSPRPHDTGMVTLISQELSEFALHVRAFLGLPIHTIHQYGPSASAVVLGEGTSGDIRFDNIAAAVARPNTQIRLFGKPEINGRRRLGVALTRRESTESAVEDAIATAADIKVVY